MEKTNSYSYCFFAMQLIFQETQWRQSWTLTIHEGQTVDLVHVYFGICPQHEQIPRIIFPFP